MSCRAHSKTSRAAQETLPDSPAKQRLVITRQKYIKAQQPCIVSTSTMSTNNNDNNNSELANEVNDAKSSLEEIRTNIAGNRANLGMVVGMVEVLAGNLDHIRGTTDRVVSNNVRLVEDNRRLKTENTVNKRQCTIACNDNRKARAEVLKSAKKQTAPREHKVAGERAFACQKVCGKDGRIKSESEVLSERPGRLEAQDRIPGKQNPNIGQKGQERK